MGLCCLLLVACTLRSEGPRLPSEAPGVEGPIERIESEQGRPRILIGPPHEAGAEGQAWVTLTEKSTLLRAKGKGYETLKPADLTPGTKVRVWFDGPVLKSLPLQGSALYILVTE